MLVLRLLRRSLLAGLLVLPFTTAASAGADVEGFARGGCFQFQFGGFQSSYCLQTAHGRGQGPDPYSFRLLSGTGMSVTTSDDGPPCSSSSRAADPRLTYFAVRPNHTAAATVHFKGTWLSSYPYNPETGQCGPLRTTFDNRAFDMSVVWSEIPGTELDSVCFQPPFDCSPGGFFQPDVVVPRREVRRSGG